MITSAANERLRLVRRLATRPQRERLGLFVCEGEDLVDAALAAGLDPVELLVDAERPAAGGLPLGGVAVASRLLAELSTLGHPARVIAVFRAADLPRPHPADGAGVSLALWRVADPGNVGTLLRAAEALGPATLHMSAGCADRTGPKALRASAGAVFRVPVGRFEDAPGRWIALVARGGEPLAEIDLAGQVSFLLGAERDGLPDELLERCAGRATIPQAGDADSLNVAMAGTVALYERVRRGC